MSAEPKEAEKSRNGPVTIRARSSRKRYLGFVDDYKEKRLDQADGEPRNNRLHGQKNSPGDDLYSTSRHVFELDVDVQQ